MSSNSQNILRCTHHYYKHRGLLAKSLFVRYDHYEMKSRSTTECLPRTSTRTLGTNSSFESRYHKENSIILFRFWILNNVKM